MKLHLNSYSIGITIAEVVTEEIVAILQEFDKDITSGDITLTWGSRPDIETDSGNPTHGTIYIEGMNLTVEVINTKITEEQWPLILQSLKDTVMADQEEEEDLPTT